MKINGRTKLLCLLGSPVKQSFSPLMHNASFSKLNINASYMAFDIEHEEIEKALLGLKAMNFIGCNVTKPHKLAVMPFLDHIDENATQIGAVNTIVNKEGKLYGYNTDMFGFIESIKSRDLTLENKTVAVLGTGGAAKAVVVGLLNEKVKEILIFSRDILKANSFLADINHDGKLSSHTYKDISNQTYDYIINTTPIGMHKDDPSIINVTRAGHDDTVFYDLIYNPKETTFLREARESGRQTINGLDMLIYQGIAALELWFEFDSKGWTRDDVIDVLIKENIIEI